MAEARGLAAAPGGAAIATEVPPIDARRDATRRCDRGRDPAVDEVVHGFLKFTRPKI
jgi:hypothetical protein